jgi:hypothetical protein
MPSRTQTWRREHEPRPVARTEQWTISLTESLSDRIKLLSERRQTAFEQAQTHRSEGHLVPLSLSEELTENASELRGALERYAEATGDPTEIDQGRVAEVLRFNPR